MTSYKSGAVVLVDFPFTDWSDVKQRPAIIISPEWYNSTHPDVIVCAITSRMPELPAEEEYLLSKAEQRTANLPKPSLVKLTKILTIEQRLVIKQLGQLNQTSTKRLLRRFHKIFNVN